MNIAFRFSPAAFAAVIIFGIAGSLSAQQSDPFVETLRQGTVAMNRQMLDIVNSINSVEDADAAEPKVAQIMNDFVIMVDGLAEYLAQGYGGDINSLSLVQNDAENKEWGEKVSARIARLQREHPEAAARFAEIVAGQSQKVMEAMTKLMLLFMEEETPKSDGVEKGDGE